MCSHYFFYNFHLFDVIFHTCITAEIALLGERQTEDLKVPGSNPENSLAWVLNNLGLRYIFPYPTLLNLPLMGSSLHFCNRSQDTFCWVTSLIPRSFWDFKNMRLTYGALELFVFIISFTIITYLTVFSILSILLR